MGASLTKEGRIPGRTSYPFAPRLEVTQWFLRGQGRCTLASHYAKAASVLLGPLLGNGAQDTNLSQDGRRLRLALSLVVRLRNQMRGF